MTLKLEVWDGSSWVDKTSSCISLRRRIRPEGLEELDGELVRDVVSVGQKIRLKEDDRIKFMGIVYEISRRHRGGNPETCGFKAYDYLIACDRHVVYKLYQTGTKAGDIIRDLGKLIDDEIPVNLSGVEDGDALLSPWEIQNQKALDIMKSVARGTNYWLRMKPCLSYLAFDGGNYVSIQASSSLDARYSVSIAAWVKWKADVDGPIFTWQDPTTGRWGTHVWRVGGKLFTRIVMRDGTFTDCLNVGNIPIDAWIFITSTYSYEEGVVRHYINGEFIGELNIGSVEQSTHGQAFIGKVPWDSRAVNGFIAQELVYNRVLSQTEIKNLYYDLISPPTDGLILFFNFNEGSGSVIYDRSGNGNHGTIYGGATWGYEVYPKYANSMLLEFRPKVIA